MAEPIAIVRYESQWPREFDAERVRLEQVFKGVPVVVEHVGSTAVPGLGAKPIIDIMIGLLRLEEAEVRAPALEQIGYEYVPAHELELPGRRYFRKVQGERRSHHLHAVVRGSEFWRRHLLFRDYLRQHDSTAVEYFELKQKLASMHRTNRRAYLEAKSDFIEAVLLKAAKWGGEVSNREHS